MINFEPFITYAGTLAEISNIKYREKCVNSRNIINSSVASTTDINNSHQPPLINQESKFRMLRDVVEW
jgi:hypothetical protein